MVCPASCFWDLAICNLYSRSTQFVSDQTMDDTTPLGLRPPKVESGRYLGLRLYGKQFLLTIHRDTYLTCARPRCLRYLPIVPLFKPMASIEDNVSEVDVLLYQTILFCGEFFKDFLRCCPRSLDCFQLNCRSYHFSPDSSSDSLAPLMQVDPRNSEALFANRCNNVFWIPGAHRAL